MFHSLYQLLQARLDAGASYPDAMLPVIILTAVGWLYVVILMSFSETSFVAGIMTFLLYGVLPLSIILYIFDAPRRRRQRALREEEARRNQRHGNGPGTLVAGQDEDDGDEYDDDNARTAMGVAGMAIGNMLASGNSNAGDLESGSQLDDAPDDSGSLTPVGADEQEDDDSLPLSEDVGSEKTEAACFADDNESKSISVAEESSYSGSSSDSSGSSSD